MDFFLNLAKQIKELKEENLELKNIANRLNIELTIYQNKYPQMKRDSETTFLNPYQMSQVRLLIKEMISF